MVVQTVLTATLRIKKWKFQPI